MVMAPTGGPLLAAGITVDLTPPTGTPLGGYILRENAAATGVHDPLEGSLLWVRDAGGGEVLWVALDALCVDATIAAEIASEVASASGCAAEAIVVCASHTHSSASGWVSRVSPVLPDASDEGMRKELVRRLAAAAAELPGRLEPCRSFAAEGHAPGAGSNRNDPAGPHDDSVGAFGLVDAHGRVAALVLDYACHATVLGHANLQWSADWPGAARRALADALCEVVPFPPADGADGAGSPGRRPTILFLQGAAGDASPRFVRRSQDYAEVDRLGGLVAAAALTAILQARPDGETASVSVRRATATVPTRELPRVAETERLVEDTEAAWRAAVTGGVAPAAERVARTRHEGTLVLLGLAKAGLPPTVEAPCTVVVIGDAAWVHLPVELFASFGLSLRATSPIAWTRVIGYSDGYLGYVADAAAHESGVYEAYASQFDAGGGERLMGTAAALLAEAAR